MRASRIFGELEYAGISWDAFFQRVVSLLTISIAFALCVCVLVFILVLSTTITLLNHVGSTSDSYEPAGLQGKAQGCCWWSQAAQEEGRCVKGTMGQVGFGDDGNFSIQYRQILGQCSNFRTEHL
jgi:hypothetical protein